MIGPVINSAAIICGAIIGGFLGPVVGKGFQDRFMLVFGCISIGLGGYMISGAAAIPPIVVAIMGGALLGEATRIEAGVNWLAHGTANVFSRLVCKQSAVQADALREQFVVFTVVFSVSGLSFFGAMREGLTGDSSMLLVKALLDFPTALFVAAGTGAIIGTLFLPQLLVQIVVLLVAGVVAHWTTPMMQADFTGCGGFITLATGFRMCNLVRFPILGMLPSLLLVMPLSSLWHDFVAGVL